MADEHGVAGGAYDHAQHGEPHISHALGSLGTVTDTQHVAHGFEQCIGVLHAPGVILWEGDRTEETGRDNDALEMAPRCRTRLISVILGEVFPLRDTGPPLQTAEIIT